MEIELLEFLKGLQLQVNISKSAKGKELLDSTAEIQLLNRKYLYSSHTFWRD
jgi:hypothetical protein